MVTPRHIPISVVIPVKNEEARIARCLQALTHFDEIVVVDSHSTDQTVNIALSYGARVESFAWDGRYPKKYQWCLDHLALKHDRIFFVDADEIVTPELVQEIEDLDWACAGYFVRANYVVNERILRYGLQNNKLCLLDRNKMAFPVVRDLDCPDMGEIEGHYQPALKTAYITDDIGQLDHHMLHYACVNWAEWEAKHQRYARWEAFMDARGAWPEESVFQRYMLKKIFRAVPALRPIIAFLHSYVLKLGFLDGRDGYVLAHSRARYYRMVNAASAALGANKDAA